MGWIGVDFDGTLATDADSSPIPAMVERVKRWLSQGIEVRIVTARANLGYALSVGYSAVSAKHQVDASVQFVKDWCIKHLGQELPVTCYKDYEMYQLWDDRAVQVVRDTGERVGNINRWSDKHIGRELIDEESGFIR